MSQGCKSKFSSLSSLGKFLINKQVRLLKTLSKFTNKWFLRLRLLLCSLSTNLSKLAIKRIRWRWMKRGKSRHIYKKFLSKVRLDLVCLQVLSPKNAYQWSKSPSSHLRTSNKSEPTWKIWLARNSWRLSRLRTGFWRSSLGLWRVQWTVVVWFTRIRKSSAIHIVFISTSTGRRLPSLMTPRKGM